MSLLVLFATVISAAPQLLFAGRKDQRKCRFPLCGGWFVRAVNQPTTNCPNSPPAPECYIATLNVSLPLSPERTQALIDAFGRGAAVAAGVLTTTSIVGSEWGAALVGDAFVGQSRSPPAGTFYLVRDNGRRCIRAPCPSLDATPLNDGGAAVTVDEVNLTATAMPADPDVVQAALTAVFDPTGLLLAGAVTTVPATGANVVVASEFYLPALRACGSRGMGPCPQEMYCLFPSSANCGRADAPGTCEFRPDVCTSDYNPVCGCDGQTYPNACTAASIGVSVERVGECAAPAQATARVASGAVCTTSAQCEEWHYCKTQACGGEGKCLRKPEACAEIASPVCGCDGQAYSNSCDAAVNGVNVRHNGECRRH